MAKEKAVGKRLARAGVEPALTRAAVFIVGRKDPRTRRDKPGLESAPAGPPAVASGASKEARAGLVNASGLTNGRGLVNGRAAPFPRGAVNGRDLVGGKRMKKGAVTGRKTQEQLAESAGFLDSKGLTNGKGMVNGAGFTNGRGLVNGRRLMYTEAMRERQRRLASKTVASLVVVLALSIVLGPVIYGTLFPSSVVTIDADFGDWEGYSISEDSLSDQGVNGNINLLGFAGRGTERDLFFYVQVAQGYHPFAGPRNVLGAESIHLLIDKDRSPNTGYLAYGLGVDYLVELSGYDGGLKTAALRSYPASSPDRTDAGYFQSVSAVRAAAGGNEVEGVVPLADMGLRSGDRPYILVVAQDSTGQFDVGDTVISSQPGVLRFSQDGIMPQTVPTSGEARLLSMTAKAEGVNMTLFSFDVFVDGGTSGAGITITRVVINGRSMTQSGAGGSGTAIPVTITDFTSQIFNYTERDKIIDVYGRASGTAGSAVVRVYLQGPQAIHAGSVPAGFSGHGSALAPTAFTYAYVGGVPPTIRIDAAFAEWNQFGPPDPDQSGDVSTGLGGATPGGPNIGAFYDGGLDIIGTRADVNSNTRQVSFYLQSAGAIMASSRLPAPSYPRPAEPSTGGGGGEAARNENVAVVYVDTDSDADSGWERYPGLGVDAIIEIRGTGGGYGRLPRAVGTSISLWSDATQGFSTSTAIMPVSFDSSSLETQIGFSELCGGSGCGRVRYVFYLRDQGGHFDETLVRDSTSRGNGDVIYFDESYIRTNNVYQGDKDQPILTFAMMSPSTNRLNATIVSFGALVKGATFTDLSRVAIYQDRGRQGVLDSEDLAFSPVAQGTITSSGHVEITPVNPLLLEPGSQFSGILTVDVSWDAETQIWFNISIARHNGLRTSGIPDVRYSFPGSLQSVRILEWTPPGARGQNDIKLNELQFVDDWIEVYDTTVSSTSLVSPALFGFEFCTGASSPSSCSDIVNWSTTSNSTNSNGFAKMDVGSLLQYSGGGTTRWVTLWCSNCTAGKGGKGGANNSSYVDFVEVPTSTARDAFGRYPDGSSWRDTDNNTSAAANTIPEFSEIVSPIVGLSIIAVAARRWRPGQANRNEDAGPP